MKFLIHVCCADCVLKLMPSLKKTVVEKNGDGSRTAAAVYDQVDWYFFNPNIHPRSEYLARMKAVQKIARQLRGFNEQVEDKQAVDKRIIGKQGTDKWDGELIVADYQPQFYFSAIGYTASDTTQQERVSDLSRELVSSYNHQSNTARAKVTNNQHLIPIKPNRCHRCWQLRLDQTCQYAQEFGYQAVTTTLLSSQYQDQSYLKTLGKRLAEKYGLKFVVLQEIDSDLDTKGFYKQTYCGCCFSLVERMRQKY